MKHKKDPVTNKTILIVDDSPTMVRILQIKLEDTGYSVITASWGEVGLKKAKEEKPDIVILDIMLPGITGYEVYERLKNDLTTEAIPIIILTGNEPDEDFEKRLKKNEDGYIIKPFSDKQLFQMIDKLLK